MRRRYLPAILEDFSDPWPVDAMNRMMRGTLGFGFGEGSYLDLRLDFYRKDGKLTVEAELPGVDPKEVSLNVYHDRLTLSAEKKNERKGEGENAPDSNFRSERWYGKIERSIVFPVEVNPDSAKASFKHGVLTVEIDENVRPQGFRKIEIQNEE